MRSSRHFLNTLFLTFMLTGAVLVSGCDSDGNDDDDNGGNITGTFDVQITGDGINESFDGLAFWGTGEDEETGEEGFAIILTEPETEQEPDLLAFYMPGSRPDEGTYPIFDSMTGGDDIDPGTFGAFVSAGNLIIAITDGTVDIETSSSTRVAGDFSLTGTSIDLSNPTEGVEVTVTGDFNAVFTADGAEIPDFDL